jgi:tRNA dimethylallyltransferase
MASSSRLAPTSNAEVVALFGPTAAGKTAVAALLRERLGAAVISADSAAVYEGLPVITATPEYPARLVAVVPLTQEISVGAYQQLAHAAVDEVRADGEVPLIVGGTGLYFRAAVSGLALPPPAAEGRRSFWQAEYDRLGGGAAHALLAERDAAAAARVHPNDRRRIVRALELAEAGESLAPPADTLWGDETRHPTLVVGLDVAPGELDRRIHDRTRAMVEAGAVEEATRAWQLPISETARKVLGLRQFATLPLDEAVAEVEQATRQLARYQRKWLRRLHAAVTLDGARPPEEIADEIVALAGARERLPRH